MTARAMSICRAFVFPVLLLAGWSMAAGQEQLKRHLTSRGNVELGGSATYQSVWSVVNDNTSNSPAFIFSAMPYVGYFLLDGVELGLNPAGIVVSGGTGRSTVTQLRILFAPAYNFRTSTVSTPFVEGLAGVTTQTTAATAGGTATLAGFTWGGRAGVKVALTEHGLLNLGVQYLQVTLNPDGATTRNGYNELSVTAGWTVWL
jgi:hypothetical protein